MTDTAVTTRESADAITSREMVRVMDKTSRAVVRLLEKAFDLYEARFMSVHFERFPEARVNHWHSLGVITSGYAFERQGRRPDYAHVSVELFAEWQNRNASLGGPDVVWAEFAKRLSDDGLNPKNNPLWHGDEPAGSGKNPMTSLTALEFAQSVTLTERVVQNLQHDRANVAHSELASIRGVGTKIASFILRDVAIEYGIVADTLNDRHLLQPIDVWIKRVGSKLGIPGSGLKGSETLQKAIVEDCALANANPERFNAGAWYVCTQVAGSEYLLGKYLADVKSLEGALRAHQERLSRAGAVALGEDKHTQNRTGSPESD